MVYILAKKIMLVRQNEIQLSKDSEDCFVWSIIAHASKNTRTRKNLEAIYIAKIRPSLNDQKKSKKLVLFRNGIT